ncbi:MAG: hypothetical protein ABJL67_11735 [Sulfitobacter sp.]
MAHIGASLGHAEQITGAGHLPHTCLSRFAPRVILGTSAGLARLCLRDHPGTNPAHAAEGIAWAAHGACRRISQPKGANHGSTGRERTLHPCDISIRGPVYGQNHSQKM